MSAVDTKARLVAAFTVRFGEAACIEAELDLPMDGFGVTALLGPSGCGKTTVLRALAGLEQPGEGRIAFDEEVWHDAVARRSLPPQRRRIGMLFQEYALFPHLSVAENVAYGARGGGGTSTNTSRSTSHDASPSPSAGWDRTEELLRRFGLGGLGDRMPATLSGGQRQRVALARTVASRPRLILLDEPLAALDAQTRHATRLELRALLAEANLPTILVTHDHDDVMALADSVVIMSEGRTVQQGSVEEVFGHPADSAVARIVGMENVRCGTLRAVRDGVGEIDLDGCTIMCALDGDLAANAPTQVTVSWRARDVALAPTDVVSHESARNRLPATVTALVPSSGGVRVGLDAGILMTALVTHAAAEELALRPGSAVLAIIKATAPTVHAR